MKKEYITKFLKHEIDKKSILTQYHNEVISKLKELNSPFKIRGLDTQFGFKVRFEDVCNHRQLFHIFIGYFPSNRLFTFEQYSEKDLVEQSNLSDTCFNITKENIIYNEELGIDNFTTINNTIDSFIFWFKSQAENFLNTYIKNYFEIHKQQRSYYLNYYTELNFGFSQATFKERLESNKFIEGFTPMFKEYHDGNKRRLKLYKIVENELQELIFTPDSYRAYINDKFEKGVRGNIYRVDSLFDIESKIRIDSFNCDFDLEFNITEIKDENQIQHANDYLRNYLLYILEKKLGTPIKTQKYYRLPDGIGIKDITWEECYYGSFFSRKLENLIQFIKHNLPNIEIN